MIHLPIHYLLHFLMTYCPKYLSKCHFNYLYFVLFPVLIHLNCSFRLPFCNDDVKIKLTMSHFNLKMHYVFIFVIALLS